MNINQFDNVSDKDKEIFVTLNDRIADYRDACQYMMSTVGDRAKAAEFLRIAENLKKIQEEITKGKKIDILKLDPPVTPVLILGYNEEERQKSKYTFCYCLNYY